MGINEMPIPTPPMGNTEMSIPTLPMGSKGFITVITTVFFTLITKTFDYFKEIGNLRKTVPEKINLMIVPLRQSYNQVQGALGQLQGIPPTQLKSVTGKLKTFFSSIITGYIASTHQNFNEIVKDITSKSFDGFMQGLGLIFPFNLLTNSLSIGKEVSQNTFQLVGVFNTFLTRLTDSVNKEIEAIEDSGSSSISSSNSLQLKAKDALSGGGLARRRRRRHRSSSRSRSRCLKFGKRQTFRRNNFSRRNL